MAPQSRSSAATVRSTRKLVRRKMRLISIVLRTIVVPVAGPRLLQRTRNALLRACLPEAQFIGIAPGGPPPECALVHVRHDITSRTPVNGLVKNISERGFFLMRRALEAHATFRIRHPWKQRFGPDVK